MRQFFIEGGWGMYPTLVFGLFLIGIALRYATRPDSRFVPLLVSLGIMTMVSGGLGFVTGLIKSLQIQNRIGPGERFITLIGLAESLNNIALALLVVLLAAIGVAVGAWRIARVLPQVPKGTVLGQGA